MSDSTPSAKTFHYKGLTIELHLEVYEPAEDTFQILEAIKIQKDDGVLELGAGCGLISLSCASQGAKVVCTDINPHATSLIRRNYQINRPLVKGSIDVRNGDMFSVIRSDERFDIIIFNPPYLPTRAEDRVGDTGWFDVATDGGANGLVITKRFLKGLSKHLAKNGCAYTVFSSLSDRTKFEKYISGEGLTSDIVSSRVYGDEQIDIYRLLS